MKRSFWMVVVCSMALVLSVPGQTGAEVKPADDPAAGTGILARSSGGPDDFGYRFQDSAAGEGCEAISNFVDITASGTAATLDDYDDGHGGPFPMGFSFPFYGNTYDEFFVGSNGTIYFVDEYLGLGNTCLPDSNGYGVNRFIALYWDDLVVDDTNGGVYYQTFSDCPVGGGQCTVIQYHTTYRYGVTDPMEFEAILYPDGTILFIYQDPSNGSSSYDNGASATVGIQDNEQTTPQYALQYSCNAASLSPGLAVAFAPPAAQDTNGGLLICQAAAVTPTPLAAPGVPATGRIGLLLFLLTVAGTALLMLRRTA